MPPSLDDMLISLVDGVVATLPRARPEPEALRQARIISHRGERPGSQVRENTFAAFDPLVGTNVWGLEFDIRYTADGVPVVYHDPDLRRLHGRPERLGQLTWSQLQDIAPDIPDARSFVERYQPHFHLMVEIKDEVYPDEPRYVRNLLDAFDGLRPGGDYHLMSLDPSMLDRFADVSEAAKISIARFNLAAISDHVLARGQAALGAHYALLGPERARRHLNAGQRLAIGFPRSRNSLFREISRGAHWIFTNHAASMQHSLDAALADTSGDI